KIERLPAEPEVPLLEGFWGKGDEAKALFRECQESIARKYGSGSPAPSPTKPPARAGQVAPRTPAPAPPEPRKPSSRTQVEQAEKAGKTVTSITTPDGTKLDFGEADRATNFNPWDRVLPSASKIPS